MPWTETDDLLLNGTSGKGRPPPVKRRSAWQRLKDSVLGGALHSNLSISPLAFVTGNPAMGEIDPFEIPLAAEPVARRILRAQGRSDKQIDAAERRLSDRLARRAEEDPVYRVGDLGGSIARGGIELLGNIVGGADPTYVLGPGKTIAQRIAAQGAINAGVDASSQIKELERGVRDEYDPWQTGLNAAAGVVLQGAGEGVGKIRTGRRIARGSKMPGWKEVNDIIVNDLEGGGTIANPKVSPKGAMGPQQVMPETARKPGFGIRPWDGKTQEDLARVGRQYSAAMMDKYDGDVSKVLAAYNAGPGRVDGLIKRYGEDWANRLPDETKNYLRKGMDKLGLDDIPFFGREARVKERSRRLARMNGDELEAQFAKDQADLDQKIAEIEDIYNEAIDPNRTVRPIPPEELARLMNDPEAAGLGSPNRNWTAPGMISPDELDFYLRTGEVPEHNLAVPFLSRDAVKSFFPDADELLKQADDNAHGVFWVDGKAIRVVDDPNFSNKIQTSDPHTEGEYDRYGSAVPHDDVMKSARPAQPDLDRMQLPPNPMRDVMTDAEWKDTWDNMTPPERVEAMRDMNLGPKRHPPASDATRDAFDDPNPYPRQARAEEGGGGQQPPRDPPPPGDEPPPPPPERPSGGDGDGSGGGDDPYAGLSPAEKLNLITKDLKKLQGEQAELYHKERSRRSGILSGIQAREEGLAGFKKEAGALKGQLPKVGYESIRQHFGNDEIDELLTMIDRSNSLFPFEKHSAKQSLLNLLGADVAAVPTPSDLAHLEDVFGKELIDNLVSLQKQDPWAKVWNTLNIPRAMMASFDLSAPLRQGVGFIGKKAFWKALGPMHKALFSEDYSKALMERIKNDPDYLSAKEAGLGIVDPHTHRLASREEEFMSDYAEGGQGKNVFSAAWKKSGGAAIRASNRAYSAFLNQLRFDVYKDLKRRYKAAGAEFDAATNKRTASFVNTFSGRGDLPGHLNAAAPALTAALFSPRFMSSRVRMLLSPVSLAKDIKRGDTVMVKERLKALAAYTSYVLGTLAIAKWAGMDVEDDARSADFGKPKKGNTRYDTSGGMQPYIRLMAQWLTHSKVTTKGEEKELGGGLNPPPKGPYDESLWDVFERLMRTKESPILSKIHNFAEGENVVGEDFYRTRKIFGVDVNEEALELFTPMSLNALLEISQDDSFMSAVAAAPALTYGVGSTTYKPKPTKEEKKAMKDELMIEDNAGISEFDINEWNF